MLHAYLFGTLIICASAEFGLVALAVKWRNNITPTHWELLGWMGILTVGVGIAAALTH